MHYAVTLAGTVAVSDEDGGCPPNADALIEEHVDGIMDALEDTGAGDPDIELDLTDRSIRIAILVTAGNPDEAIAIASPIMRRAIQVAGGSTPEWPDSNHRAWAVRRVTLSVHAVELAAA